MHTTAVYAIGAEPRKMAQSATLPQCDMKWLGDTRQPGSITYLIPGTVSDVSILGRRIGRVPSAVRLNTLFCSLFKKPRIKRARFR